MSYAQKNYNQPIGGGNGGKPPIYTIRQVGCFLTAFCNLLEGMGKPIDPLTLNQIFIERGVYIDLGDGVKDELGWQSVTGYDGQVVVSKIGPAWPTDNNSIVRFVYNGGLTHFCKVYDWEKQLIVDSFDGIVKGVGYYGQPVQFATYKSNTPQAITPVASADIPTYVPTGEHLHLPASADTWAVYHLGTPGRKGTTDQAGTLLPSKYGGLSYSVLGHPMTNFVTISTQDFGTVNIYMATDTGATIDAPAPTLPPGLPAPIPEPVVVTTPQDAPLVASEEPAPAAESPVDPEAYKRTFDTKLAGDYKASSVAIVKDLSDELPDITLPLNVRVQVSGTFVKDGATYYRTKKSALPQNDWWYGIPEGALSLVRLDNVPEDDSEFDLDLAEEVRQLTQNIKFRQRLINFVAALQAFFVKRKVKNRK